MKISLKIMVLFLILLTQKTIFGQFYDIGQAPASTRWGKIETGNFSIIYPDYYYLKARDVAREFRLAEKAVASGLHARPRHTPLILHPLNPVSNAYAIWAPRRIEILTTPPQDLYAQPWIQQLALHEYRHVVQLSSLDQGFTAFLGYLMGQQAAALSAGIFVPSWFLEGDAVATETALSNTGRGRVPSFSQTLRAQLSEKGVYSFPKASLGSYRDFVPDIYTTGYHIVAAARRKYGPQLWAEAMNTVARQPWAITPFNKGLRKVSGLNKKGIYRESFSLLDSLWKKEKKNFNHHIPLAKEPECYTSFIHPHRIDDSTIVALKKSFSDIPQLVSIDADGKEKKLVTPGYIIDERVSYSGGVLAWAEYRPHIRWETAGFTTIVIYDPQSRILKQIVHNRKLYAPVVSPVNNETATIEYKPDGKCNITIFSPVLTTEYPLPDSIHASTPTWSPEGAAVVFIATGNHGKALARLNLDTGTTEYLTVFSFNDISNPFYAGDNLCFTGTVMGKNQIFMSGGASGKFFAVSDATYGADYASARADSLIFSDYTADGYRIASVLLQPDPEKQYETGKSDEWPLAEALSAQETQVDFSESLTAEEFKNTRYKKAAHLFGIHSWAPVYVDIGGETVRPGISVMSQNLLSTLFVSAGYDYNIQEEAGMLRADVTWKGWFPVLKATVSEGLRAANGVGTDSHTPERYSWNETNLDLSISQSLNFSHGPYYSGVFGEAGYNYAQVRHNNSTPSDFVKGALSGFTYRTAAYVYRRQAFRDLGPRKGFYIDAEYRHSPLGQIKAGNILGIQVQLFAPGFFANHSILFYAGIQKSKPEKYRFSNIISTSRGYTTSISGNELVAMKIAYRLPLIYPDLHLGGLLYVKRIRANLFYDITAVSNPDPKEFYNSSGLDLIADFHLFGLSTPVSAGIRTVYLEKSSEFTTGLLLSVNLYDY